MKQLTLTFAAALTGCTITTGVIELAPETYAVAEPVVQTRRILLEAELAAYKKATAFCAESRLRAFPLARQLSPVGNIGYSLTFQCFLPGDPMFASLTPDQPPLSYGYPLLADWP